MNTLAFLCFLMLLLLQYVPLRSADKRNSDEFEISAKLVGLEPNDHHIEDDFEVLDSTRTDLGHTVVSVDAFGAVGDGISDDTKAFVNAWKKACSKSNSVLLIPEKNHYLVNATRFNGPCIAQTVVQIDGTIVAPGEPKKWDPENARVWLGFYSVSNTKFQGNGLIDGSGSKWWSGSCKRNKTNKNWGYIISNKKFDQEYHSFTNQEFFFCHKQPCKGAPTALTIDSSSSIRVTGLTIENAQQMHLIISNCDSVHIAGVQVTAPGDSPNTDGIHITKSTNVVISNCIIGTGDDCISIVNGSTNIQMKNIYCGPGHGISTGSLGKGQSIGIVENVVLDTAYLQNTTNGLRIKTWQGGSGYVKAISYKNVRMDRVPNPIIIDQFYCDSPKSCHNQTSAGEISDIAYNDISGTSNSYYAMKFSCSDTVPCANISLSNINLRSINGSKVDAYCNSASGELDGHVQPPADCLSSAYDKDMIISQKTEVGDTQSIKEHIIHTEL